LKDFSIDGEFDEEKHAQLMELLGQESDGAMGQELDELANLLDEYFQLHYEDVVSGVPTRFKYTDTKPENFGLTALDILEMDDSELDRIMPFKNIVPYGEQMGRRRWKPKEDKKKEYRKLKRRAKRKQIPTEVLREYKKPKKSE
jgi:protein KRI1